MRHKKIYRENKVITGMCPYCFYVLPWDVCIDITVKPSNREKHVTKKSRPYTCFDYMYLLDNNGRCPKCKSALTVISNALIEIDSGIAESISTLNKKGYYTKYCCEGHESGEKPYIYFESDEIIKFIDILGLSWYLDISDYRRNKIIIRSDVFQKEDALSELNEWVNMLPIVRDRNI